MNLESNLNGNQLPLQINIFDQAFQKELRIFCHFYQIPFLDANIPKTARNAAKIYYRLKQDRL